MVAGLTLEILSQIAHCDLERSGGEYLNFRSAG
jgi:hypothetical protein